MALVHATASITPTKAELIAAWLPLQPWGPPDSEGLQPVGSYRLDDPEGEVGAEVHFVVDGDTTYQVRSPTEPLLCPRPRRDSSERWTTPCSASAGSTTA